MRQTCAGSYTITIQLGTVRRRIYWDMTPCNFVGKFHITRSSVWHSCFVIGRFLVQISSPEILAMCRAFSQSNQIIVDIGG
jgi:hypothetical protein